MEVPGGHNQKWKVFQYEFLGTAILTYAVLVSGGDKIAVPLTVFFLIIVGGPICGAHFNPAVSTAVYITNRSWRKDRNFFILINIAELMGAMLGIVLAYIVLMPSYIEGDVEKIPAEWLSPLCPVGVDQDGQLVNDPCDDQNYRTRSAFFFQTFGTFIFVSTIVLVKDEVTTPSKD